MIAEISKETLQSNIECFHALPQELLAIRKQAQKDLSELTGQKGPFVVTGSQLIFFHPGILSKEIAAARLAAEAHASAITLVLDHDAGDLLFAYPVFRQDKNGRERAEKMTLHLGRFFCDQPEHSRLGSELWSKLLDSLPGHLHPYLTPDSMERVQDSFDLMKESLKQPQSLVDFVTQCRLKELGREGLKLSSVRVSQLAKTTGWKMFCELIIKEESSFRKIYNHAVESYRSTHKIKNHAQPVPNLKKNEIPLWVTGKDIPGKQKAFLDNIGEALQGEQIFLPRAITLSIFARLFLSDLFIHGLGGAKYDMVTEQIIRDFFHCSAAKFGVMSATMHLQLQANAALNRVKALPSPVELKTKRRQLLYHPDTFLPANHPLVLERKKLIESFTRNRTHQGHLALEKNRSLLLRLLEEHLKESEEQESLLRLYRSEKKLLNDRTLPYFFYPWKELL